jgi:hypothetical protein
VFLNRKTAENGSGVMMTRSEAMELPFYLQKAVDLGLLIEDNNKIIGCKVDIVSKATEVARIVDKLQPTSVQDREDTTIQEAIVLSRTLSSPPGLARELWAQLRTGFGIGHGQMVPLSLWSDSRFKAIAKEIDLIFIGDRSGQILSKESIIAGYTNLNDTSRIVPLIDFITAITELSDPDLIKGYGDPKSEWDTALDVLKQVRVRALYLETLHNAQQNIKADTKLEEALEYLQQQAMEGVGMMRGSIGNQGQAIGIIDALIGDPGGQRLNWVDRFSSNIYQKKPASTGIAAFDIDIGGGVSYPEPHRLFGGRLMTIGARTKVGKTAFGCQIATSLASKGLTVGFISAELDYDGIEPRIIASLSRKLLGKHGYHWKATADRNGYVTVSELVNVTQEDKEGLVGLAASLAFSLQESGGKLLLEAPWGACVDTVVSSIRSMKAKNPELRCVVLDHFHALSRHKGAARDSSTMLEERAYKLMTVAKEVNIDLFVLAQMNQIGIKAERNNVTNETRAPELDEIRGTDALNHVSHAIWLIRKHKVAADNGPSERKLEVWHAASRNGQHFWEGDSPNERIVQIKHEVQMSLVQLDYPTQSLRNDDTMQNVNVVKNSKYTA